MKEMYAKKTVLKILRKTTLLFSPFLYSDQNLNNAFQKLSTIQRADLIPVKVKKQILTPK